MSKTHFLPASRVQGDAVQQGWGLRFWPAWDHRDFSISLLGTQGGTHRHWTYHGQLRELNRVLRHGGSIPMNNNFDIDVEHDDENITINITSRRSNVTLHTTVKALAPVVATLSLDMLDQEDSQQD